MTARRLLQIVPVPDALLDLTPDELAWALLEDMQARVNYDLDYLRYWTPMLDIKILLLTAVKVFRDDKAY